MQGLSKIKTLILRFGNKTVYIAAGIVVCAAAAAVFVINSPKTDAEKMQQDDSSQISTTESEAEKTTQKLEVINFKKASLSEYDMAQTEIISAEEQSEVMPDDPAGFKVQADEKDFSFSDVKNPPAHLYATRDISSEFFTVRDITTRKLVTMNAYELVCSIVYNEVGDGWGSEAIKAQAVAAYSCLRYMDSIGMIETVGIKRNYTPKIESCVRAVQGQAVTYNGSIANTLYSASTAGYTLPSNLAIVSSYPYLKSVKSAYDSDDPNWGRKTSFSKDEVKQKLEKQFGIKLSDDVKKWFRLTDVRYGKYVMGVSVDSQKTTTGKVIANLFKLRSNAFDINFSQGRFYFSSYGWGHGVGMSQWGACMYARHGYTYDQILTHYYVNTRLRLSNVSTKAVERGKKTAEELEREAETAVETTIGDDETQLVTSEADTTQPDSSSVQQTSADTQQTDGFSTTTLKTSAGSGDDPVTSETTQPEETTAPDTTSQTQQSEDTQAEKVTKTAETAE